MRRWALDRGMPDHEAASFSDKYTAVDNSGDHPGVKQAKIADLNEQLTQRLQYLQASKMSKEMPPTRAGNGTRPGQLNQRPDEPAQAEATGTSAPHTEPAPTPAHAQPGDDLSGLTPQQHGDGIRRWALDHGMPDHEAASFGERYTAVHNSGDHPGVKQTKITDLNQQLNQRLQNIQTSKMFSGPRSGRPGGRATGPAGSGHQPSGDREPGAGDASGVRSGPGTKSSGGGPARNGNRPGTDSGTGGADSGSRGSGSSGPGSQQRGGPPTMVAERNTGRPPIIDQMVKAASAAPPARPVHDAPDHDAPSDGGDHDNAAADGQSSHAGQGDHTTTLNTSDPSRHGLPSDAGDGVPAAPTPAHGGGPAEPASMPPVSQHGQGPVGTASGETSGVTGTVHQSVPPTAQAPAAQAPAAQAGNGTATRPGDPGTVEPSPREPSQPGSPVRSGMAPAATAGPYVPPVPAHGASTPEGSTTGIEPVADGPGSSPATPTGMTGQGAGERTDNGAEPAPAGDSAPASARPGPSEGTVPPTAVAKPGANSDARPGDDQGGLAPQQRGASVPGPSNGESSAAAVGGGGEAGSRPAATEAGHGPAEHDLPSNQGSPTNPADDGHDAGAAPAGVPPQVPSQAGSPRTEPAAAGAGSPASGDTPATAVTPPRAARPTRAPVIPPRQIAAAGIVQQWDHFTPNGNTPGDNLSLYQTHVNWVHGTLQTEGHQAATVLAQHLGQGRGVPQPWRPGPANEAPATPPAHELGLGPVVAPSTAPRAPAAPAAYGQDGDIDMLDAGPAESLRPTPATSPDGDAMDIDTDGPQPQPGPAGAAGPGPAETTELMNIAHHVIGDVTTRISRGPGNQAPSIEAQGGTSQARAAASRTVHLPPTANPRVWWGQRAAVAESLGIGNCGEHAAMAFTLLNRWPGLPPGVSIFFVGLNPFDPANPQPGETDHAFAAIGRPEDPLNVVIVDAWQINARPVLARNFNFAFLTETGQITAHAERFDPDGHDYLQLGHERIDAGHVQYLNSLRPDDYMVIEGDHRYAHAMPPPSLDEQLQWQPPAGHPHAPAVPVAPPRPGRPAAMAGPAVRHDDPGVVTRNPVFFDLASHDRIEGHFDVRWIDEGESMPTAEVITALDIQPGTGVTQRDIDDTFALLAAGHRQVNDDPATRLPNGSRVRFRTVPAASYGHTHHSVTLHLPAPGARPHDEAQRPMDVKNWITARHPVVYLHENGHQMGLRDESWPKELTRPRRLHHLGPRVGGMDITIKRSAKNKGSLMGDFTVRPPDDESGRPLPRGGLRPRHLALLSRFIGDPPGLTDEGAQNGTGGEPAPTRPVDTAGSAATPSHDDGTQRPDAPHAPSAPWHGDPFGPGYLGAGPSYDDMDVDYSLPPQYIEVVPPRERVRRSRSAGRAMPPGERIARDHGLRLRSTGPDRTVGPRYGPQPIMVTGRPGRPGRLPAQRPDERPPLTGQRGRSARRPGEQPVQPLPSLTQQLLSVGDAVIHDVQRRIRPSNQEPSLSFQGGTGWSRLTPVRRAGRQPGGSRQEQLGQEAAAADRIGWGNCGEHAALTFTLLNRRPLPDGVLIYYVNLRPAGTDHTFVAVGSPRNPGNTVIVDPWQVNARAVRAEEFNFLFLTPSGRITEHAIPLRPDGVDYLAIGRQTIDMAYLDDEAAIPDDGWMAAQPTSTGYMWNHPMPPPGPRERQRIRPARERRRRGWWSRLFGAPRAPAAPSVTEYGGARTWDSPRAPAVPTAAEYELGTQDGADATASHFPHGGFTARPQAADAVTADAGAADGSRGTDADVVRAAWYSTASGFAIAGSQHDLAAARQLPPLPGVRTIAVPEPGAGGGYTVQGRSLTAAELAGQIAARLSADGGRPPAQLLLHGAGSEDLAAQLSIRLATEGVTVVGVHGNAGNPVAGGIVSQPRYQAYRAGQPLATATGDLRGLLGRVAAMQRWRPRWPADHQPQ